MENIVSATGRQKHQPLEFSYPTRQFGKTKIVTHSFQTAWYEKWKWLHYLEESDSVICFTCAQAVEEKKLRNPRMETTFVVSGFTNWKDATASFRKHEASDCHQAATEIMLSLPQKVQDVGEMLSSESKKEKAVNHHYLLKVLSSIRFLARQGHYQ
ncbi:PREDICTED: uncharacterized protein LOC105313302 [Amphimedon queenslandica]|uniref:Uncharacterized protein n=1 Tax=Amphimedon queenslandica TaxID=400682 RepID=A0A1X7UJR3_AMPQE|nr:PREDICTED: uncharacterized protein LOC105313302 [Amphimedon queenslandica]|eukprot:XP_011404916.1 PREDICTED: uncharacterized protein LOC105313302 [Amphimedon queenslandica]